MSIDDGIDEDLGAGAGDVVVVGGEAGVAEQDDVGEFLAGEFAADGGEPDDGLVGGEVGAVQVDGYGALELDDVVVGADQVDAEGASTIKRSAVVDSWAWANTAKQLTNRIARPTRFQRTLGLLPYCHRCGWAEWAAL